MTASETPDFDGVAPQGVLAGPGTITVIAGLTFAISDERGDIGPGPFGLITADTRHLSRLPADRMVSDSADGQRGDPLCVRQARCGDSVPRQRSRALE